MKFGWLKKIGRGAQQGLDVAAQFEPHLQAVSLAMHAAEGLVRGAGKGADKKALVEKVSDLFIESDLTDLTPEQEAAIKAARSALIDAKAAAMKTAEQAQAAKDSFIVAKDAFMAAIAAVRKAA